MRKAQKKKNGSYKRIYVSTNLYSMPTNTKFDAHEDSRNYVRYENYL